MKKILHKVLSIIPLIFILIAIILIVQLTVSVRKGNPPAVFGYAISYVKTGSMEDTIMTGDVIFVNTKATDYNVGDIIMFHNPSNGSDVPRIVTHRIVNIETEDGVKYYTTKGDNNSSSADWETKFTQNYIIGKYLSKSTFLGKIYSPIEKMIEKMGVSVIFIGIIVFFLVISTIEIIDITKNVNEERNNKILEERDKMVAEELEKLKQQQEESDKS